MSNEIEIITNAIENDNFDFDFESIDAIIHLHDDCVVDDESITYSNYYVVIVFRDDTTTIVETKLIVLCEQNDEISIVSNERISLFHDTKH